MDNKDEKKKSEMKTEKHDNEKVVKEQSKEKAEKKTHEEKKKKLFSKTKVTNDIDASEKLSAQIEELQKKLDESNVNLSESKDKYLRLFSEFDNYRKRTNKEKLDLISYANGELILKLLPIVDDMERAEEAMKETEDVKSVREGCELIYNKFIKILSNCGLEVIESTGKTFDAEEFDAVANFHVEDEKKKNIVIDTTEKGYKLNGKIIRHAKVVVGN